MTPTSGGRTLVVRGPAELSGSVSVPGDKSISHRALLLGATSAGRTTVRNLGSGEDVASTAKCLEQYGVNIERSGDVATVHSRGIADWSVPSDVLDCGNSGTTMRILAGLAARREFESVFDGDPSLRRRPMERVARPLRALGAHVLASNDGRAPLTVRGGNLKGADVEIGVASAQVKTAVLLAALGAEGRSSVTEPLPSRDHTERMLQALGAEIIESIVDTGHRVEIMAFDTPPFDLAVPGDVSSASFIVAAGVLAGAVRIDSVGLNPSRIGFLETLELMGASIRWEALEDRMNEPVGMIDVERSDLRGIVLDTDVVPRMHDELPLLAVLATQAEGETVVRGAQELRIKETDRIEALVAGLRPMGADIEELPDGFIVRGRTVLEGSNVSALGDHRIAMALAVAGLIAKGETRVEGFESSAVSWPGFDQVLASIGAKVDVS